jgi:hypothetical protein
VARSNGSRVVGKNILLVSIDLTFLLKTDL